MRPFPSALALIAIATTSAVAQLAPGDDAPTYQVTDWFNHAPIEPDGFRGRVLALCFLRLEEDRSFDFLSQWRDLSEQFALEPVSFVAITNEAPDYVKGEIERETIRVPIAINPTDDAATGFQVQLFPSVVVVSPSGTVTYHDKPGGIDAITEAINEELPGARPFPPLEKGQKSLTRLIDSMDYGKAYADTLKALDSDRTSDGDRPALTATRVLMEDWTARIAAAAERAIEAKDWLRAVVALHRLATEHAGIPGAETASSRLDELKGNDAIKTEVLAAIDFAKADLLQRQRDWKKASKAYSSLTKKWPDTAAAEKAAGLIEVLKGRR